MSTHIYHGVWVNWSHGGYVRGATLTLSEADGGLLTAFIAAFVGVVGGQLWKIITFIIHQWRSTNKPEDGLHHQQQALWRNSAGPGSAAWSFAQQTWFWRSTASYSFLRTFSWSVFSTVYLIFLALAAVFSSQISKAPGSQRLVIGDNCGYWRLDPTVPQSITTKALSEKTTNDSQVAFTYARACYGGVTNPLQCSRYAVPSISWDTNANATCPFPGQCFWSETAAFELTSHRIDSQRHLGMNTPKNERLEAQKKITCAPIRMKPYVNETYIIREDGKGNVLNDTYYELLYGPFVNESGQVVVPYTDTVSTHGMYDGIGYTLSAAMASANRSVKFGWQPVPAIAREDADVVLVFLHQNGQRYEQPSFDPFFAANYTEDGLSFWMSDFWVNTLGCAEQYRYCNPTNKLCTDYLGSNQLLESLAQNKSSVWRIGFNNMQIALATRISYPSQFTSVYQLTSSLGASALRAQEISKGPSIESLPPTQWHTEVTSWFSVGLASLQQLVLEYATGPNHLANGAIVMTPAQLNDTNGTILGNYLCNNQIVNDSSDTMSFSVFGMAVLFAFGGLIIVTSFIIDRVVGMFQQWFNWNLHGRRAWFLDDKLQMQKIMFERSGQGHWRSGEDTAVPMAISKEKFSRFVDGQPHGASPVYAPVTQQDGAMFYQRTAYSGAEDKAPGVYVQPEYKQPF